MAGESTIATSKALLKEQYEQDYIYSLGYPNNPEVALTRKKTDGGGDPIAVVLQGEVVTGGGATVADAQSNMSPGDYTKFQVNRITDYTVARVNGHALRACKGNKHAVLDLWEKEVDGAVHHSTRSMAVHYWRNGTGSRGQLSSASNVATNVVTLANPSESSNFYVNMRVQASLTDGSAILNGGAVEKISAINRKTGDLTSTSAAWNSVIAGITNTSFLYRKGDGADAGTNKMITGRLGWIPDTVTATLFWNVNRTKDTVRYGGNRINGLNGSMGEVLQDGIAEIGVEGPEQGGDIMVWVNPRDRSRFAKELGTKVTYARVETTIPGSKARIGFRAIEIETDNGTAKVMSTVNIPTGRAWIGKAKTVCLDGVGPLPGIINDDGMDFLRVTDDDAYEVRVGAYVNQTDDCPAAWCNVQNFGVAG